MLRVLQINYRARANAYVRYIVAHMRPVMQSDQCKTVYFSSLQFQVSGFRFQTLARADVISAYMSTQHMLPVTLTFSILLEEDLMRIISQRFIHSQPGFRFQVSIAFLRTSPLISESTAARLSFQISLLFSDFRVGVGAKSKSGVRFQISDFRLAQGRGIEIGSFISISGFDCRVDSQEKLSQT